MTGGEDAEAAAGNDDDRGTVFLVLRGFVNLEPRFGDIGDAEDRRILTGLWLRDGFRAGHGEVATMGPLKFVVSLIPPFSLLRKKDKRFVVVKAWSALILQIF